MYIRIEIDDNLTPDEVKKVANKIALRIIDDEPDLGTVSIQDMPEEEICFD